MAELYLAMSVWYDNLLEGTVESGDEAAESGGGEYSPPQPQQPTKTLDSEDIWSCWFAGKRFRHLWESVSWQWEFGVYFPTLRVDASMEPSYFPTTPASADSLLGLVAELQDPSDQFITDRRQSAATEATECSKLAPEALKALRMRFLRASALKAFPFAQIEAIGLRVHIEGGGHPESEETRIPERSCMRICIAAVGLELVDSRLTSVADEAIADYVAHLSTEWSDDVPVERLALMARQPVPKELGRAQPPRSPVPKHADDDATNPTSEPVSEDSKRQHRSPRLLASRSAGWRARLNTNDSISPPLLFGDGYDSGLRMNLDLGLNEGRHTLITEPAKSQDVPVETTLFFTPGKLNVNVMIKCTNLVLADLSLVRGGAEVPRACRLSRVVTRCARAGLADHRLRVALLHGPVLWQAALRSPARGDPRRHGRARVGARAAHPSRPQSVARAIESCLSHANAIEALLHR
jgi:hypothetical protein